MIDVRDDLDELAQSVRSERSGHSQALEHQRVHPTHWLISTQVDATGFRRKFVKHDVAFDPGYQVTYGALLKVQKHPFPLDKLVLMDYRDEYIGDDVAICVETNQ